MIEPDFNQDGMVGYTEDYLRQQFIKLGYSFENFKKWMNRKTVGVLDGKSVYWYNDVANYIAHP